MTGKAVTARPTAIPAAAQESAGEAAGRTGGCGQARGVATAASTATPSAAPISCPVIRNPDAIPACWAGMPASAVIETATKTRPTPSPISSQHHKDLGDQGQGEDGPGLSLRVGVVLTVVIAGVVMAGVGMLFR